MVDRFRLSNKKFETLSFKLKLLIKVLASTSVAKWMSRRRLKLKEVGYELQREREIVLNVEKFSKETFDFTQKSPPLIHRINLRPAHTSHKRSTTFYLKLLIR